jgi:hypothetical protein
VTEYAPGYYLAPTVEDYDSVLAIVADLEETLMGNPNTIWGYADQWLDNQDEVSVGDPSTYVETIAVPPGYVYVLEHYTFYHNGGVTCACNLIVNVGGANPIIYNAPAVPSLEITSATTNMTMKEGDTIQLRVTGLPLDKVCTLRCLGYKMVVPE